MPEEPNQDIILTCQPEILRDRLRMSYRVSNRGQGDVYVLDVFPAVDPETRKETADYHGFYLCLQEGVTAYLLKGIPPLPANKQVYVRIMPLGTKLAPGGQVERSFEVPFPLREQSPWYYLPLPPEGYETLEVRRLLFVVQFLRAKVEGFTVEPAPHGEGLYRVGGKHTVGQAEKLSFSLQLPPTKLLKRTDLFSRL